MNIYIVERMAQYRRKLSVDNTQLEQPTVFSSKAKADKYVKELLEGYEGEIEHGLFPNEWYRIPSAVKNMHYKMDIIIRIIQDELH